jgi:hypothetical protein
MKNERTPRTMADCEFTVGSRAAELARQTRTSDRIADLVMLALAAAFAFAVWIGWI